MLQWSHGILAMESGYVDAVAADTELLQWSHGILAMESVFGNTRSETGAALLQWSHGILAMERCRVNVGVSIWSSGFNGAMAF